MEFLFLQWLLYIIRMVSLLVLTVGIFLRIWKHHNPVVIKKSNICIAISLAVLLVDLAVLFWINGRWAGPI